MNKKLKIAVSCLSFIMCLFVVISVGSPRKASAHNTWLPSSQSNQWYRPLLPMNTSMFNIVNFNNDRVVDIFPTEFYSGDGVLGVGNDTYFYESISGFVTSEVAFDSEVLSVHGPYSSDYNIYYDYKDVTWAYSLYPSNNSIDYWFLYSEYFIIFEEMNNVGYFTINNHSDYDITVAYSINYRIYNDLTSDYITSGYSNEITLAPLAETNLYTVIKSEFDGAFNFYDVDFVYIDLFGIRFSIDGLSSGQVDVVDLFINYPAFETYGIIKRSQGILIPRTITITPECPAPPPPEVIYETVYVYEIDWFQQITSDIDAVMSIEIIPGISFYDILLICITIPILIAILKVWLGG